MTVRIMGAERSDGATKAGGILAHAEGSATTATGPFAHAEGTSTTASAQAAHAEGTTTSAQGSGSHAEGSNTVASGPSSHAEGQGSQATTTAAHAEGVSTTASGLYSHAEGYGAVATGTYGHAEGNGANAAGPASHAEGQSTYAFGYYSHAGGINTTADALGAWARSGITPGLMSAGRAQAAMYDMGAVTTTATATTLTFDGSPTVNTSGNATNVLFIPLYATYLFNLYLCGRRSGTSLASAGWWQTGMVARDSGTARLVGAVTQTYSWADTAIGSLTITVNTTSNTLQVAVLPNSTVSTVWHATLQVNELTALS